MKILMIDTSTTYLYVKFFEDESNKILFEKSIISHNNHSENLINVIEEGLGLTSLKLKDFNKVIVGKGPGSYTGLRVGMVVAKMVSFSLNIPLYTISSLQLVGSGYLKMNGLYCISNIAKKDYCYGTIIEVKDEKIKIIMNDTFLKSEDFLLMIKNVNGFIIDEKNYNLDMNVIIKLCEKVDDIHNVVPNYLRLANQ